MTLLVITYLYPPAVSPRAFRWSSIAAHWAAQGHEVDIVCGGEPGNLAVQANAGPNVRIAAGRSDRVRARTRRRWVERSASRGTLDRLLRGIWQRVYWPDYACLWFGAALREGRRFISARHYDALITVSIPFTAHLVGLLLKRASPQIPWIVDVGDPFSFGDGVPQNNTTMYRGLNRLAERTVLRRADAVAVTTPQTLARYAGLFPGIDRKVVVIPPVCAIEALDKGAPVFPADDKFRLVFLGTLYRDIRNPGFLLDVFARLLQSRLAERLELHFFGEVNDCDEVFRRHDELLGQKIFLHGVVDRHRALRAMAEARVLVNIGNNTAYQLPSKLVEYVHQGKPVLNVVRRADDSSITFLEGYPAAHTLVEGPLDQAAIEALARFIESPQAISPDALRNWRDPFTVESVAAAYLDLIPRVPASCASSTL